MTTQDAALQEALDRVEAGADLMIEGGSAASHRLLGRVADGLRATCSVVEVAAPAQGLGVSALMAQLSGRPGLRRA